MHCTYTYISADGHTYRFRTVEQRDAFIAQQKALANTPPPIPASKPSQASVLKPDSEPMSQSLSSFEMQEARKPKYTLDRIPKEWAYQSHVGEHQKHNIKEYIGHSFTIKKVNYHVDTATILSTEDGAEFTIDRDCISLVTEAKDESCKHVNKYINNAMHVNFWVCPDCKADLGDVK